MLNIGGWNYLPISEASGTLGTVPSGLHPTLYLSPTRPPLKRLWFFYHIIPSPSSAPTLPSLSLQFLLPCLPPPPSAPECPALIPRISKAVYSHHCLDRRIPVFRSTARHKSMIGLVVMYCVTMFWRRAIKNPISSSPTIYSTTPISGYTHVPSC